MDKPSGENKKIGDLVVPRGVRSRFQLRIKIPVLFCCIHAYFSVHYPVTAFVEIHGDAAAHPVAERKTRVKDNKTSQATALSHSDAQVRAPTLVSSTLELPRSVLSIRGAPTAGWGIRTSHGPAHLTTRITTRPESVPCLHWCGCMSISVSRSWGGKGVRGGDETAGTLMSAVSQWKGAQRWRPAVLTCDWLVLVWVYRWGKIAGMDGWTRGFNKWFVNNIFLIRK